MALETEYVLNVSCDHEGCGETMYDIGGWEEEPVMPDGWVEMYEQVPYLVPITGAVYRDDVKIANAELNSRKYRSEQRHYCPEHAPMHEGESTT